MPTHRKLLSGIQEQLCCQLCLHTGTYSRVFWYCLLKALLKQRNLFYGILFLLYCQMCLHIGTYSQEYCFRSAASYKYTQEPTLVYPVSSLLSAICIHTGTCSQVSSFSYATSYTFMQEPTFVYPVPALLPSILTQRDLLLGILFQLCCQLRLHRRTSSLSSCLCSTVTYDSIQEPTLGYLV